MKAYLAVVLFSGMLTAACDGTRFAEANGSKANLIGEAPSQGEDSTAANDDKKGSSDSSKGDEKGNMGGEGKADEESEECQGVKGADLKKVHISGSDNVVTVDGEEAALLKVTGSENAVSMTIPAESALKSLCLDVSGNQNKVTVEIKSEVATLFVKARGNQANIEIITSDSGVLSQISLDRAGNDPKVVLKGEGALPCKANLEGISCE